MFGMIAMHFNDKIKKDMQRLHVKSCYHAKKRQKISQCVTLMPLEAQGHVLHFQKPPIIISWDPDCHEYCSTLNICQAMLKNGFLLNKLQYA